MQHTVNVTYGKGFNFLPVVPLREKIELLQEELLKDGNYKFKSADGTHE